MSNITSQTDIEIYVQAAKPEAIRAWLATCATSLDVKSSSPKRQAYWASFTSQGNDGADAKEFEILVLSNVQGNFSSIWFNSPSTPWDSDKACALQAFEHFQSAVRCVASGWQEGDAPDQWLNIDAQGESLINWL